MAKQSNHNRAKQKISREQRDNRVLRQVFRLFLLGIAAECYLFLLNDQYINGNAQKLVAIHSALPWVGGVGLGVMLLALVLLMLKKGGAAARKVCPWAIGLGGFFGVTSLLLHFLYPKGGTYLCVMVPILTVLGMVYLLFQREFFVVAVVLSGAIFTVWVCRKGLGTQFWNAKAIAGSVLVLLGLAALTLLTVLVQRKGGKWIGRCGCRIFPADCNYSMLYIAYGVAFVAVLLALLVVGSTYYSMWALAVVLFAFAVYYTTKLM